MGLKFSSKRAEFKHHFSLQDKRFDSKSLKSIVSRLHTHCISSLCWYDLSTPRSELKTILIAKQKSDEKMG